MAEYNEAVADWPALGEVKAKTGMSERTVYRAVADGKLRTAQQPISGRKPLTVYHPDDVEALERAEKVTLLRPAAESAGRRQDVPPPEFWQALVETMRLGWHDSPHPAELPAPEELPAAAEEPAEIVPSLAELRNKLIVTREEAKRLGFTSRILALVERFPGGRYKMRDLEAL